MARRVLGNHHRMDAAAHREVPFDAHPPRREGAHQIVEHAVDHRLVEVPLVAERPEVELERLELDAFLVGHVADAEGGEVGLTGHRAEAGELRAIEADFVIPRLARVGEGFEVLLRVRRHPRVINPRTRVTQALAFRGAIWRAWRAWQPSWPLSWRPSWPASRPSWPASWPF